MGVRLRSLAALLILALVPGVSSAKPKHTKFEDVIKNSPIIVVAKYPEKKPDEITPITLNVVRVLRGDVKPGELKVEYKDHPSVTHKDREFIAFLDAGSVWRFVAVPVEGKTVEGAVLELHGFYDYNAHYVTPGLLTEELLKGYLKDGALTYKFRGALYFPLPGKEDWKASGLVLTGRYDAIADQATHKDAPQLKGFPTLPKVRLSGWHGATTIALDYSEDLHRPFELLGTADKVDKQTGELLFRFVVIQPEVLTEKALTDYLASGEAGGAISTFKLTCAPVAGQVVPKTLSLVLGRSAGRGTGRRHIEGWAKEPLSVAAEAYQSRTGSYGSSGQTPLPAEVSKELAQKDGVFRMAAPTSGADTVVLSFEMDWFRLKGPFVWTFRNDLLFNLYAGPIKGSVSVFDGKELKKVGTFTTSYEGTTFNPPGN
jgi:hypothetical protein